MQLSPAQSELHSLESNLSLAAMVAALMHMRYSIISPWPVLELTGAQWVKPLPQASYNNREDPDTVDVTAKGFSA